MTDFQAHIIERQSIYVTYCMCGFSLFRHSAQPLMTAQKAPSTLIDVLTLMYIAHQYGSVHGVPSPHISFSKYSNEFGHIADAGVASSRRKLQSFFLWFEEKINILGFFCSKRIRLRTFGPPCIRKSIQISVFIDGCDGFESVNDVL